jgi:hypothetical protein
MHGRLITDAHVLARVCNVPASFDRPLGSEPTNQWSELGTKDPYPIPQAIDRHSKIEESNPHLVVTPRKKQPELVRAILGEAKKCDGAVEKTSRDLPMRLLRVQYSS